MIDKLNNTLINRMHIMHLALVNTQLNDQLNAQLGVQLRRQLGVQLKSQIQTQLE